MKELLSKVKEQLFDAPNEVKESFNKIVEYFAQPGNGFRPTFRPSRKGKDKGKSYTSDYETPRIAPGKTSGLKFGLVRDLFNDKLLIMTQKELDKLAASGEYMQRYKVLRSYNSREEAEDGLKKYHDTKTFSDRRLKPSTKIGLFKKDQLSVNDPKPSRYKSVKDDTTYEDIISWYKKSCEEDGIKYEVLGLQGDTWVNISFPVDSYS